MIDFEILKSRGTTNERLKEIFTAKMPSNPSDMTEEERRKKQKDIELRKKMEELMGQRLMEQINFNLANHFLYSAVDLAWDSQPINKSTYPLMLYAQGKLDLGGCAAQMGTLPWADKYITRNKEGVPASINLPAFLDVSVNLVRSVITRRLAAQSNKFNNLWPFYRYEARGTSQVAKLRADVMSQKAEIICDQFDYRHHDVQLYRDMMLYGHTVDFPRCAWETENQWEQVPVAPEAETGKIELRNLLVKDGVCWVNPHPSRVFWDNAHPLSSINSDTGCEYIGFWDAVRYKDVAFDTRYWNTQEVTYSSNITSLFSTYAQYFSQYYCTIKPPASAAAASDLTGMNDRQNNVGLYAGNAGDAAMILANYFWKLVPVEWGIGDYPYPVWVRFVLGGDNTVLFAEIYPDRPAAYGGHNESDNRQVNISLAHELMSYQDHMSNLLSYLLLCIKADNQKVLVIDVDTATAEAIEMLRAQAKGKNAYTETLVLEVSRKKLEGLGIDVDKVIRLIETRSSAAIDVIFRAMLQLMNMVERLMALSPQEQGQPAPREISATETNLIAGTTESVYGFISDSIDELRAAKKRILYASYIALGHQDLRVPVIDRYSRSVIEKAGFTIADDESEDFDVEVKGKSLRRHTIIGTKRNLLSEYIFTTRDGAERASNTQAANVLVQLLGILQQPAIIQAIGKEKLYEIVNEIFRLSGTGVDLRMELREGESDAMGVDPTKQLEGVLQQLAQIVEKNAQDIEAIKQALQGMQGAGAPGGMQRAA